LPKAIQDGEPAAEARLDCATRIVNRDWRMAQAWLRRELAAIPPR
jgi:hypothetical protein